MSPNETASQVATEDIQVRPDRDSYPAYTPSTNSGALRQGELLCDVVTYIVDIDSKSASPVTYKYLMVVSQDCELDQHFRNLPQNDSSPSEHPFTLFVLGMSAADFRKYGKDEGHVVGDVWRQLKQNTHPRYQFLDSADASKSSNEKPIPELVLDFKKIIAIPSSQLYSRNGEDEWESRYERMSELLSPYKENLQQRFVSFLGRVGLDLPHRSV